MNLPKDRRLLRLNRACVILKGSLVLILVLSVGRSLVATLIHNIAGLHYLKPAVQIVQETGVSPWEYLLVDDGPFSRPAEAEMALVTIDRLINLAVALDQDDSRWYYVMGQAKLAQGDLEAARVAFASCLAKDSDSTGLAHFLLGAVYELDGQRDQAILVWRQAPTTAQFFLAIGAGELYIRDNPRDALEYFSTAAEIAPMLCEPRYRLGVTWLELGDRQQALLAFSSTEALNCSDDLFLGESYYQQGKLLADMGRNEEAIEVVRRSLSLDRHDVKRLLLLGDLLQKSGNHREAYSLFIEAVTIAPEKMGPYISLCDFERLQKDYTEALSWCEQAVERFPESAYPYHYTGLVYIDMESFRRAASCFEMAAAHETTNVNIWIRLGEAYTGTGELDRALAAYQRALQVDPKNSLALQRIDQLAGK